MLVSLKIVHLICLLIGIIVCAKGMKSKDIIYKGGLLFFLLIFMENVYSLTISRFMESIIQSLIEKGNNNLVYWINMLSIPTVLLNISAYIILIVYLLKGMNRSTKRSDMNNINI